MVCPITVRESYVRGTGKSMKVGDMKVGDRKAGELGYLRTAIGEKSHYAHRPRFRRTKGYGDVAGTTSTESYTAHCHETGFRRLLRGLILAQRIHHLLCFSQAAAVEFAGGVYGGDGLPAGGEFAELLLLFFAAERFQVREVLS
jgi:hypothetical protein